MRSPKPKNNPSSKANGSGEVATASYDESDQTAKQHTKIEARIAAKLRAVVATLMDKKTENKANSKAGSNSKTVKSDLDESDQTAKQHNKRNTGFAVNLRAVVDTLKKKKSKKSESRKTGDAIETAKASSSESGQQTKQQNEGGAQVPNVGRFFVSRSGGLTLYSLIPIAIISYVLGDSAYSNLQRHYQKAFIYSTAQVDVIGQMCNSRSDILWKDCEDIRSRGTLSERFIWAWMVSADIIDPLNIPTPAQLEDLKSKDRSADIVYRWIKDEWGTEVIDAASQWRSSTPQNIGGIDLLFETSTLCFSGATGNKEGSMRALIAAYLSDLYPTLYESDRWLSPELFKALGVRTESPALVPVETLFDEAEWLAPADVRALILTNEQSEAFHNTRADVWKELNRQDIEESALDHFLGNSADRLVVASHIGDDDIVATLFAYGGLISTNTGQFRSDFLDCTSLEQELEDAGGAGGIDSTIAQTTLTNFEKLALHTAGQIRVSPEVKRARFWVSIYTGHEQRWIMILGAFGFLVVCIKIAIFSILNLLEMFGARSPSLTPFENPEFDPEDRDNEFDSLASSRWAMKIPIALLPAIGFIGTVRGIMLSLSGADAIVWAETVNERSSAISGLSADLGLAFATTLLALLGGAILTLLSVSEIALGERLLLRRYSRKSE